MRQALGIATAVLALMGAAAAASMTKDEYQTAKKRVAAQYQSEREKCGVRHGNSADLCIAHAHGTRDVARAELEAEYKPGPRAYYDAAIARAKATYAFAREECDNQRDVARTACIRDARTAQERANQDARAARSASAAPGIASR